MFLNIYSSVSNKSLNSSKIDVIKTSLFSYVKFISQSDTNLKAFCNRIIESYSKQLLISKYKALKQLKSILRQKITSNFNSFIFHLSNRRPQPKLTSRFPKYFNENRSLSPAKQIIKRRNPAKPVDNIYDDYAQCTFSPKINQNFKPYSRVNQKPLSQSVNNLQTCCYSTQVVTTNENPIGERKTKSKEYYSEYPQRIVYYPGNSVPKKERYNFYMNQSAHVEKVREKILNMKMKKLIDLEEQCTFSPKINNYQKDLSNSYEEPRYIKLNNDAIKKRNNLQMIRMKIDQEEEERNPHIPRNLNYDKMSNSANVTFIGSNNYYKKLYNDATLIKNKKAEKQRESIASYTFTPAFTDNPKYKVKTTFNERRNKSIEDRKKNRNKKEEEEKEEDQKRRKSRPTQQRVNEANKNVVERLYKKGVEKILEKKQKEKEEEEKYKKKKKRVEKKSLRKHKESISQERDRISEITETDAEKEKDKDYGGLNTSGSKGLHSDQIEEKSEEVQIENDDIMNKLKSDHRITFKNSQGPESRQESSQRKVDSNLNTPLKNQYMEIHSLSDSSHMTPITQHGVEDKIKGITNEYKTSFAEKEYSSPRGEENQISSQFQSKSLQSLLQNKEVKGDTNI